MGQNKNSTIFELIKSNPKYDLKIFSKDSIKKLEESIFIKNEKPYLTCLVRNKAIQVKPEEIVRQLLLDKLINEYNYPKELIEVEFTVTFGREKKKADIVILNKKDKTSPYIIVEVKKANAKDGKEQLKSYTNATGAPLAVWTNGSQIDFFERLDPNYFEPLTDIPKYEETIDDVKQEYFTYLDLMVKDRLSNERKSLKDLILDLENEVLSNAGVDIFEEVFKLIFTKLYDEMESAQDRIQIERDFARAKRKYPELTDKEILELLQKENQDNINNYRKLEFRSRGDAHHTKEVINKLFDKAKKKWPGIFESGEPLRITDENHLQICVASFQNVKLFNSNLQVIDEAFEYLVAKSAKGEKGQYFTPRNVIDMAVYMINPTPDEYVIDTAAGSCGFTVHTLFNVWEKLKNQGKAHFHNFSNQNLTAEQRDYVDKVFGIDFDEKSVRVAKTLNMIAGDGKTNVLHLNSLDFTRWNEKIKDREWMRKYGEGYYRLLDLAENRDEPKTFNFDIVMANPPFAGDIKEKRILAQYDEILRKEVARVKNPSLKNKLFKELDSYKLQLIEYLIEEVKNLINKETDFKTERELEDYFKEYVKDKYPEIENELLNTFAFTKKIKTWENYNGVSRDILFIERNLNMLKPGGRMAIVLPQGRFNNTSDQRVREYIMQRARLIAVVGLDVNTFKPHTGTKTSVLFVQKWNDDPSKGPLNPKLDDYEIFMAVSEKSGKDNSGEEVYKTDPNGNRLLDEHGHLILDHDLEEIAKAFEQWAKEQGLSFWK